MTHLFPLLPVLIAVIGSVFYADAPSYAQTATPDTAAAKAPEKPAKSQERMMELFGPALKLAEKGPPAEAVAAIDKVLAANPEYAGDIALSKFFLLLRYDEDAAQKFATRAVGAELKGNANFLNVLAWTIVDPESKIKKPDYAAALAIAEAAVASSKLKNPLLLDTLSYAYEKVGDLDKALATEEKVVALYPPDSKSENLPGFIARVAALKKLKAAAAPAK